MHGGGFDFPPMPAPEAQPPRPGIAASGPGVAGPLEGHAVYVAYEEKKELAERKAARKSGGHTYVVKFFLCDTRGTEYLAATGALCSRRSCAGDRACCLVPAHRGAAHTLNWHMLPVPAAGNLPCDASLCASRERVWTPAPAAQARTRGMPTTYTRTPLAFPSCVPTTRR